MSLISSALSTIKKGSSALDKNEVEKGIVKSYKKESAKKFVGGGSNTEVGVEIASKDIKKTKVGKGVGYSNIVDQLNGILATTDGIKNTLLTDYANEVKKNRAEKRISNAEKRRKKEDNLESKSNKKGKGFSVPGFISKPASSIFDWILNFVGMTILGSFVNLGLKNFDKITKFFKDITGSGGGLNSGNIFWLIRAALYKLIIPKFFIKLALRGLGLLLSPLKLITAPFRFAGGLIFNTLKFVGNTLFNWTSKIVKSVTNIGRSIGRRVLPSVARGLGSTNRKLFPGSPRITPGGYSRTGKTSPSGRTKGGSRIQKLHGHSAADLYENSYKNARANGKSPTDAARRANADVKKALKKGRIVSKPQSSLAKIKGSNVFRRGFKPNRMILKIFGKGPAKFLAANAKIFAQFGKVLQGSPIRIPVIGPLMVAALSLLDPAQGIKQTLFKTLGAAIGGAIGLAIPIPVVGMVMGEMIGEFVGDLLFQGMVQGDWAGARDRLKQKLLELLQGGKEALEWVGGGASRFYEALPKIKIPDFPKDPPGVLKDIPLIGGFLGGSWEKLKIALKVMLGPLSLLMGKEIPDIGFFLDFNNFLGGPLLLKSFFPDGFVNTMKSAATSFLGMEGESENQFEENGNNNFNDSGPSGPASYAPGQIPSKVRNDVAFTSAVTAMAKKYNIPEDYLYAVMSFETGGSFSPSQKNMAGSGATGLIQFMPSTARGLGTTTDALAKMSRAEQMVYVDKYFSNKGITGGSLSDVYMAVLFPAAVGKSENFVLFGKGAMKGYTGIAYRQNSGLDINRDGSVTKAEASAKVTKNLPISTPDNSTQISPNSQSSGNSSSITGSSSKSSSPSSVSTYASYENGGDDSNTIVVTLPDRYYQSGSESSSLPILAMDSKSILNSYYKSQLVGFLYKQG